jgi:hypothetical protein
MLTVQPLREPTARRDGIDRLSRCRGPPASQAKTKTRRRLARSGGQRGSGARARGNSRAAPGDARLPGRAAERERGIAVDQRGVAVGQRGADDFQGRIAVHERGAADDQRRTALKLDDLALAQSDMQNLLNSTDIATLFLDNALNVRRFTEHISRIVQLREGDIGRPLSDLASTLIYPQLHADANGDPAHAGVFREADRDHGRPLVHGADHALPHRRERDPGRCNHLRRHHRREGARVAPAQP